MGTRIKQLREALGLSQSELARRIKIRQPSLSNIESGATKELAAPTLLGLCRELKTTPAFLLNGRAEPSSGAPGEIPREPLGFGEWLSSQPLEFQQKLWNIAAVLVGEGATDGAVEAKMPATRKLREAHGSPAPATQKPSRRKEPEKPEASAGPRAARRQ